MGPKKKKGGKSSPAGKKKAEQLARLQKEQEEEQKRLEEEEAKRALEAAKVLLREQARRNQLLRSSCNWFKRLFDVVENLAWEKRLSVEWQSYLNCKNLPIASDIPMINTYLFMLKTKRILWQVKNCFEMSPKLLAIIETLDDYIDNPLGASYERIENWIEVRKGYRDVIQEGIDMMCYRLLRSLDENLQAVDLWTYEFRKSCDEFFVGLWAFGEYPKLTGYPDHNFDEIGVNITLPVDYINKPCALRVMKLKYNHLNDLCITNTCPTLPEEYSTDFYSSLTDWFTARVHLIENFKIIRPLDTDTEPWYDGMFFCDIIDNGLTQEPPKKTTFVHKFKGEYSTDRGAVSILDDSQFIMKNSLYLKVKNLQSTIEVPIGEIMDTIRKINDGNFIISCDEEKEGNIKSIRELVLEHSNSESRWKTISGKTVDKQKSEREDPSRVDQVLEDMDSKYTERILWKRLETDVEVGEINLRKYNVIGNMFTVELFNLPEQQILLNDISKLRTIRGEAALEKVDFDIKYIPPVVVEEKQEDEEGKERRRDGDIINKLVSVTVALEENCLWFEPPNLVQWNAEKKCWTDEYIVDCRFNEEKQNYTFRSGRLGIFGFMVQRYSNLPYQTWELRPESANTVLFNLTASTVVVDFKIKNDKVCIVQIQNAPSAVLDHLIDVYMDAPVLIKKMRRFGLDLFPDLDTFHYVEGSTYKDILLENHTYACMALLSAAYNFTWSRWNSFSGRNKIVFQMRESLDKNPSGDYQMFAASTERALIVDCTEVSPSFYDAGVDGMDFYPDLYSTVCYHSSDAVKRAICSTHPYLVQTVYTMLSSTRIFTFS